MMAIVDVASELPTGGPMAQVRGLLSKGGLPSGAVLHSSREPGVRRPCSDFMDMLWRLINCRIIIIYIAP